MTDQQMTIPTGEVKSRNPNVALSHVERQIAESIHRRDVDSPVPASVLSMTVGLHERAVRNIVRDLVIEHGMPIGSVSAANKPGFYWIADPEELQRAADRHIRFVVSNIRRAQSLLKLNRDELVGQIAAELGA